MTRRVAPLYIVVQAFSSRAVLLAWACASLAFVPTVSSAQDSSAAPTPRPALASPVTLMNLEWQRLDPQQKRLLAPLAGEWNSLEASSRARWLELAARYHSMPPEEQERLQARIASWNHLSPAEREQVRLSFQQARQLKPQDREAKWEAYQALPQERREELAGKAAQKRGPAQKSMANAAAQGGAAGMATDGATISAVSLTPAPAVALKANAPGPSLLQAKPGATTNLITPQAPPAALGVQRRFFDAQRLNSKTLLPLPAHIATEGKP